MGSSSSESSPADQPLAKKPRHKYRPKVQTTVPPTMKAQASTASISKSQPSAQKSQASASTKSKSKSVTFADSPHTTRSKTHSLPSDKATSKSKTVGSSQSHEVSSKSASPSLDHSNGQSKTSFHSPTSSQSAMFEKRSKEKDDRPQKPPAGYITKGLLRVKKSLPAFASKLKGKKNVPKCPPGVRQDALVIPDDPKFILDFSTRPFCPTVTLDFESFKRDCKLDLSPWYASYEPLVVLHHSYSPEVVKVFYFNMTESKGEGGEIILRTRVRDHEIEITAALINQYFGISVPPIDPEPLSTEEYFHILFPNLEYNGFPLSYKPSQMPKTHRILWYLYSRNIVNKGQGFTHIVLRDYEVFGTILMKQQRDLGKLVISEMSQFLSSKTISRKNTIPYPNIVSQILLLNNIWYLIEADEIIAPKPFSKSHLRLMKIYSIEEDKGKAPMVSRTSTKIPDQDESSRAGTPTTSTPSFAQASTQAVIEHALHKALAPIQAQNLEFHNFTRTMAQAYKQEMENLHASADQKIKKLDDQQRAYFDEKLQILSNEMNARCDVLFEQQKALKKDIQALSQGQLFIQKRVDDIYELMAHIVPPKSPSSAPPTSASDPTPSVPASISPNPMDMIASIAAEAVAGVSSSPPSLMDDKGGEKAQDE